MRKNCLVNKWVHGRLIRVYYLQSSDTSSIDEEDELDLARSDPIWSREVLKGWKIDRMTGILKPRKTCTVCDFFILDLPIGNQNSLHAFSVITFRFYALCIASFLPISSNLTLFSSFCIVSKFSASHFPLVIHRRIFAATKSDFS